MFLIQGASRVLAEGRSRAFMQGYTSMESLLTPPLGYCFYCRCRIYHFQSLQSLLSAVLLVFQDHPSCRGESVSVLLQGGCYVVLQEVVYNVRELQTVASATPRSTSYYWPPRFTLTLPRVRATRLSLDNSRHSPQSSHVYGQLACAIDIR